MIELLVAIIGALVGAFGVAYGRLQRVKRRDAEDYKETRERMDDAIKDGENPASARDFLLRRRQR